MGAIEVLLVTFIATSYGVWYASRNPERVREFGARLGASWQDGGKALLGALAVVVFLGVFASEPSLGVLLLGVAGLGLLVRWWAFEFSFLMGLHDADFPGRYDKPIWAATITLLGPVGLWMFRELRLAKWPAAETGFSGDPARKPAAAPEVM